MNTSLVHVDDTELAVDDRGTGIPVVFANAAFGTSNAWTGVISQLNERERSVVFDMRGRGRSAASADYSLAAYERDLDAVISASKVDRPVLVGWSLGAHTILRWAAAHPGECRGLVLVDGGYPFEWSGAAERERTRALFRRQALLLPLLARMGMAGRMSAAQHADVIIELNDRAASLTEAFAAIDVPVNVVVATGGSTGSAADDSALMRASLDPVLAAHPDVRVFATVPSNHLQVLRKHPRVVADAVRDVIART